MISTGPLLVGRRRVDASGYAFHSSGPFLTTETAPGLAHPDAGRPVMAKIRCRLPRLGYVFGSGRYSGPTGGCGNSQETGYRLPGAAGELDGAE